MHQINDKKENNNVVIIMYKIVILFLQIFYRRVKRRFTPIILHRDCRALYRQYDIAYYRRIALNVDRQPAKRNNTHLNRSFERPSATIKLLLLLIKCWKIKNSRRIFKLKMWYIIYYLHYIVRKNVKY